MLLLTIESNTLKVPEGEWLRFGALLLVLLAALHVIRMASRTNIKVLLFTLGFIGLGLTFNWVYNRNEPEFLRGYVEAVEPFFPKRVDYKGI